MDMESSWMQLPHEINIMVQLQCSTILTTTYDERLLILLHDQAMIILDSDGTHDRLSKQA